MEIKVNVQVDLSERAERFLSALLGEIRETPATGTPEKPEKTGKPGKSEKPEIPETSEKSEPAEKSEKSEKSEVSEQPVQPEKPEKPKEICSDEVLRAYMDNIFKSLIGDDWETVVQTDPMMKQRQRVATQYFKKIAAELGAAKPTALPQSKRPEFIEKLLNITLDDNGEVSYLPF